MSEESEESSPEGPPARLDPVLEWWLENYALIRNLVTRQYSAHLVTYDQVVEAPSDVLPDILEWLGVDDIEAGVEAVEPDTRTQHRDRIERTHEYADVFDELYALVHEGKTLTAPFVETLNETHRALLPEIEADRERVMKERRQLVFREAVEEDILEPDALETLVHPKGVGEVSDDE